MIALHRLVKRQPRSVVVKRVGIGAGCFLVLAGAGVLFGYTQRDTQTTRDTAKRVAASTEDDMQFNKKHLGDGTSRGADNPPPPDESQSQPQVQGATVVNSQNLPSTEPKKQETKLTAAHADLFDTALLRLKEYGGYINSQDFDAAKNVETNTMTAVGAVNKGKINADEQYTSSLAADVNDVSSAFGKALNLYILALNTHNDGGDPATVTTQANEAHDQLMAAEDSYNNLPK